MDGQQLVDQTRETLGGGTVEVVNRLEVAYTPGDLSITLQYPPDGLARGVPLCVGLNTMMVWGANSATREVEVEAGWAGSPNVAAAVSAVVRVRPTFFTHRIFEAINDGVAELSPPLSGVYGVVPSDSPYERTVDCYDLTDAEGLQSIASVQYGDPDDTTSRWATLSGTTDYELRTTAPTEQIPSGRELRIHGPLGWGSVLRVTYRSQLQALDGLTSDVSMTGLPETAYDLPVLGAAARLAIPGEHRRNLLVAQPDTRRASEVPPGAVAASARLMQQRYEQRVHQEAARLIAAHPYRVA